jgi:hypothetical protein
MVVFRGFGVGLGLLLVGFSGLWLLVLVGVVFCVLACCSPVCGLRFRFRLSAGFACRLVCRGFACLACFACLPAVSCLPALPAGFACCALPARVLPVFL